MKKARSCYHCGKRFLPRISRQRFCVIACRQAWASLHDKRKNHKRRMLLAEPPVPPPIPNPGSDGTLDRLLSVLRFARYEGFDVVVREHVNGGIVAELELRGDR